VAAAHWCGSKHIANASRVSGLIYLASMAFWLVGGNGHIWRYAALDLFALAYFYLKWSARDAQHRQFHFLMMLSYLASTGFYAFRTAVDIFPGEFFGMSRWWYELISNLLFELELILIIVYALLHRRARADRRQFRQDAARWADKVAKAKRDILRGP